MTTSTKELLQDIVAALIAFAVLYAVWCWI